MIRITDHDLRTAKARAEKLRAEQMSRIVRTVWKFITRQK